MTRTLPAPVRSPRFQAQALALVLLAAVAKVVTYDHPPGVEHRDLDALASAMRDRGSARVLLRTAVDGDVELGLRITGEGAFRFSDGVSYLTVDVPNVAAARGLTPRYSVMGAGGRGYVRGITDEGWAAFDEPKDELLLMAPTVASFLSLFEDGGRVRRDGGGSVGGVGCDRYLFQDSTGRTLEVWVDAAGLPRRVAWRERREAPYQNVGINTDWRIDLSGWGEPVEVPEAPTKDEISQVGTARSALSTLGYWTVRP